MDRVGKKSTSNLGAAIKVPVNTGRTDFRFIYKEREESDKVNYAYTESKCMNVMKARQKCWEKVADDWKYDDTYFFHWKDHPLRNTKRRNCFLEELNEKNCYAKFLCKDLYLENNKSCNTSTHEPHFMGRMRSGFKTGNPLVGIDTHCYYIRNTMDECLSRYEKRSKTTTEDM